MNIDLLHEMVITENEPESEDSGKNPAKIAHPNKSDFFVELGIVKYETDIKALSYKLVADSNFIYANGVPVHTITNQQAAEIKAFKRAITGFRGDNVQFSDDWWDNL